MLLFIIITLVLGYFYKDTLVGRTVGIAGLILITFIYGGLIFIILTTVTIIYFIKKYTKKNPIYA